MHMNDLAKSTIRTYTPMAAGALISWLASQGLVDPGTAAEAQAGLIIFLTAVTQGIYYTAVRLLASKWPTVGFLLGYNKQPNYSGEPDLEPIITRSKS